MNAALLRDKKQVAQSFSRAAATYDSVATLQREVADRLIGKLPAGDIGWYMDLGCGTGYAAPALNDRYPGAFGLSLDLAEGMLKYARDRHGAAGFTPLCGDAEALPLKSGALDLVFSSLALQWCEQPKLLFSELSRVLRPGGHLVVATLGPSTLGELKAAWAAVDEDRHVNDFLELDALQQPAQAAGLRLAEAECQHRVLEYATLKPLMRELKALGAHNVNHRERRGLAGRTRLNRLSEAYETMRGSSGMLPATYEIYYLKWVKTL
ncbi:MAG: malonyl-[acyl-carrier protein] O-methyltransferase BioC [Oceanospirillaceae bacterium]|nr:malonyl-[acyl-carrier protein] O-methyltransferase BioC [Oceanospirillaceae bacterium]